MSTSHFMMELKVVSWMPALSRPIIDGWNSTSGQRKRSLPMVMTWQEGWWMGAPKAGGEGEQGCRGCTQRQCTAAPAQLAVCHTHSCPAAALLLLALCFVTAATTSPCQHDPPVRRAAQRSSPAWKTSGCSTLLARVGGKQGSFISSMQAASAAGRREVQPMPRSGGTPPRTHRHRSSCTHCSLPTHRHRSSCTHCSLPTHRHRSSCTHCSLPTHSPPARRCSPSPGLQLLLVVQCHVAQLLLDVTHNFAF